MNTETEIMRWASREEGQFYERKSALDRSVSRPKARPATHIAHDIADTLSAMANADGGEMVVGIEDDGLITGVPHPEDKVKLLLGVPNDRNYINPILSCKARVVKTPEGKKLLHFNVDWSPNVHQLADGRCLLRVRDANAPFRADQIAALKATKSQGLLERFIPPGAKIEDVDLELVRQLLSQLWGNSSELDILKHYGLIEWRNDEILPTFAALLLFGKDPERWHPRCGVDFIRWEGTERKHGNELNISKRIRITEPLSILIEEAQKAIRPFIRERKQLHDLFFSEKLEYPTFAWQEAIVNAVAHRDYSLYGSPIEIWMFDDRMEIRSPGPPPSPVTIDALNRSESVHFSRNPLIVRVLSDLQYMLDVGEGVPRIFAEMHRAGCYPPRFDITGGFVFDVTLRNEPVYDETILKWLRKFNNIGLSGDQKRMLVYAHSHGGQFTSRNYQDVIRTDIYRASAAIKDMIRKGVVKQTKKRGKLYEVSEPLVASFEAPQALAPFLPTLLTKGKLTNQDVRQITGMSRNSAARLLKELVSMGWLSFSGKRGTGACYYPIPRLLHQSSIAPNPADVGAMTAEIDAIKK
jgi:ATP-dependent DNA helicase RecG